MKRWFSLFLILTVFFACNKPEQQIRNMGLFQTSPQINAKFSVVGNRKITKGQKVELKFVSKVKLDSLFFYVGDSLTAQYKAQDSFSYVWNSSNASHLGKYIFRTVAYKDSAAINFLQYVIILSNIKPKLLTYKVIRVYPHDSHAYTQGLVYQDGILYESTGLRGESSIRKEKLETGEIIQSYSLLGNYFGEGIAIWKNEIVQLTWQSHVGFVYDKNTLQKLGEFTYTTEGWGMTQDGKHLIMSDGTNKLYFLDPQTFRVENILPVYDNKGPVRLLNELEYIKGKIYANVYTKDTIVVIDPHTGSILAYIDMAGILPSSDRTPETDVLNGIAYDKTKDRIFVTGKNWPKLFWVKFVKK